MDSIFILLFELGFAAKFNFIGEISVSEIFLLLTSIPLWKSLKPLNNRNLKTLTWLFIVLIGVQILTEFIVGNTFANALKGIMVSVISYLHLCFLYRYFLRSPKVLAYACLGVALRAFFWNQDVEFESFSQGDVERTLYVKFVLSTFVTFFLLFLVQLSKSRNAWLYYFIFVFVGAGLLLSGARNAGVILILTGIGAALLRASSAKRFYLKLFIMLAVGYGGYCLYVSEVLKGGIKSGNSSQILDIRNPYNPIALLEMGRTEVPVGLVAFSDKPLTGWGYNAKDPDLYYTTLLLIYKNYKHEVIRNALTSDAKVPSHSVIVGLGTSNGVLGFLIISCIFGYLLYRGVVPMRMLSQRECLILFFFILSFIWNMWFSPFTVFRIFLPVNMAAILYMSQKLRGHASEVSFQDLK